MHATPTVTRLVHQQLPDLLPEDSEMCLVPPWNPGAGGPDSVLRWQPGEPEFWGRATKPGEGGPVAGPVG